MQPAFYSRSCRAHWMAARLSVQVWRKPKRWIFRIFPICRFSLQGGCLRTQGPALQLPAKQFLLIIMIIMIMIIMITIIMITIIMIKSRNHYHELQKSSLASTWWMRMLSLTICLNLFCLLNNFVKKRNTNRTPVLFLDTKISRNSPLQEWELHRRWFTLNRVKASWENQA